MPGIGNCDAAQVIVALRYYADKLRVGESVELPVHPNVGHRFHFPARQWQHACRAARRLAMVSFNQPAFRDTGRKLYRIEKTALGNRQGQSRGAGRVRAGDFDNWILSARAEKEFMALPVEWKTAAAEGFLGEHSAEFSARTRAFWETHSGRKVVELRSPERREAPELPDKIKGPTTGWQPAKNTLQWKLRGFLNRP